MLIKNNIKKKYCEWWSPLGGQITEAVDYQMTVTGPMIGYFHPSLSGRHLGFLKQ